MTNLAQLRTKIPYLDGLDDDGAVDFIHQSYYPDMSRDAVAERLGIRAPAPQPKSRSAFDVANDTVIEGANALFGAVKSVGDFVAPGNRVSRFIDDNLIKAGEANQSDAVKAGKADYQQKMAAAQGFGDEVSATLEYAAKNPIQVLAQAAGSFVVPGGAIKGTGMLAQAAGLGAKGTARAGLAGGAAAGAVLSGGDAAGSAYEQVLQNGGTEAQAQTAARQATVIPAVVGGLGGVFGAERLLAGVGGKAGASMVRRAGTAAVSEGAQEAFEEGVTQFEAGRAAAGVLPEAGIDPWKGVAGAATMGGLMGGATGGAVGALTRQREQAVADVLGSQSIDQAIEAARQAISVPAGFDADKAMAELDRVRGDDEKGLRQFGRGTPPPWAGNAPAAPTGPSVTVGDTISEFSDRVLSVREQLADPVVRESLRARFGNEGFQQAAYYATMADNTGVQMPDATRERMVAMAEQIIEAAQFSRTTRPGVGGTAAPAALRGGVPQPARIGLDTARTGTIRVDGGGNAAPETRADAINTRQRMQRPAGDGRGMDQQAPVGQRPSERPLPTGEATELTDSGMDVAEFERLPVGEATEVPYIPTGEAAELPKRIPVGKATEIDAETIQADDLLTIDGMPYGSQTAAKLRARREGLGDGNVVKIPNAGWVVRPGLEVRPSNTRGTNAADALRGFNGRGDSQRGMPDVAEPAGVAAESGARRAPDDGRGGRAVGQQPDGDQRLLPTAGVAARRGGAAVPAGNGAAGRGPSLSTGQQVSLAGKTWTVEDQDAGTVTLKGQDGTRRTLTKTSKSFGQLVTVTTEQPRQGGADEEVTSINATAKATGQPVAGPQPTRGQDAATEAKPQAGAAGAPQAAPTRAEAPVVPRAGTAAVETDGLKTRKSLQESRVDAALEKPVRENGEQMTRREWVKRKLSDGLTTKVTQEDRIKPMSRMAYFRANNEEQRAHDRKVKEAGKKDVYWIGDYEVTKIEHDYANALTAEKAAPAVPPAVAEESSPTEAPADVSTSAPNLNTSPERVQKTAGSEQVAAPVATHKDPGEPAEPVTPAVVREAIKTGVQATDRKPSAMKAELLREIDQAVKDAPDYGDFEAAVKSMGLKEATLAFTDARGTLGEKGAPTGYSRPKRTFKVDGDGVFTVQNTVRQLLTFRAKVDSSPGFSDRKPTPGLNERATTTLDRRSTDAAIANMVDEGDFQAALDFAAAKEVDIGAVKLPKLLRDRLEKWQADQESAKRLAEYKPAPSQQAAATQEDEAAAPAPESEPDATPGIASQTFDQWVRSGYAANEYKDRYLRKFDGDEKRAMLGAAVGIVDRDRTTPDLLKEARSKYLRSLLDLPRETNISLEVWDALDNFAKVEAQRHFYDLDTRITRRTQDETKARVEAERIKKAPYEAAFAEVDAEIRRLDKLPGPVTKRQNELSARRDRLREALYQIGQGKEPDGRLLRKVDEAAPAPQPAAESELDLKGFTRTPRGNGAFDLSDGNMRVSVEPTERGKFQARFGSAKSSPHLQGEQGAVDWAAQYRKDGATAEAEPAQQASAILDAAADPPKGRERLEVLKDVKAGAVTPEEVAAAYPAKEGAAPLNTEDAGAELTYNKRNRIKTGIKWDDIASKNDALKVKEAVKQNVYPRPDYQALVDGGMQPLIAHLVKQAYDAIAAKPNTRGAPTDADLQTYIAGVGRVMVGVLSWANDPVSLSKWATREARSAGAMLGKSVSLAELAPGGGKSMLESVYPEGWKGNQAEVIVLGGNKLLGALQPSYEEAKRAGKAVDAGWPAAQEAWEKRGLKIVHAEKIDVTFYEGKRTRTDEPYVSISYRVGGQRLMDQLIDGAESKDDPKVQAAVAAELAANEGMFIVMDKLRRIVGKQETEEAAKDVARELTKREGKESGPDDSGIDVAMARREGPPRRLDGENVSSDKLKEAFGFKGVNFGNWMKGDTPALRAERQAHLNHAYDSFADLADLFGVPPKAMSLNGMLGLAIGAQGNGKYAAHFVPGVNEINLTRASGAGSLAHEWGHALDHYFAEQAGFAKRDEPFLTEHTTSVVRKVVVENGRSRMVEDTSAQQIRPEIVGRFKAIVQAMNKKPETLEEFNARQARSKEIAKSNVNSWLKSIRRDYVAKGVDESAVDAIAARILALDLGDGKIMVSPTLAVHPVVDELRALYRKKAGRVPPIDQIKGLQSNLDYYAYAMSEKPGAVDHVPQQVSTNYANAAAGLDKDKGGKRYWSTNLEKFARAFDAFVSDELEAKAAKNTYLSHAGRTGDTVPMGEERATINAAIKALVGEIQTREDDAGNVAMFSRREQKHKPRGVSMADARAVVANVRRAFPGSPAIYLHESINKAPEGLKRSIKSAGAWDDVEAALHNGEIHVFPERFSSIERMEFVVGRHEIRHFGFAGLLGEDRQPLMLRLYNGNDRLAMEADMLVEAGVAPNRAVAVEEMLADMPVTELEALKGWRRFVAEVKMLMRRVAAKVRQFSPGLADAIEPSRWSDDELVALVKRAEGFARNAGPSGAAMRGTAFSTAEDQTQTPAFRRWFGDSKVVDSDGKPLVVYHGTTADFAEFSSEFFGEGDGNTDWGDGFYFTNRADAASGYAEGEGGNVMPVFLAISNPAPKSVVQRVMDHPGAQMDTDYVRDELERRGYDGIAIKHKTGAMEYVAFRPEQIKSAIGNRGTFDPASQNIMFSRATAQGDIDRAWRDLSMRNKFSDFDTTTATKVSGEMDDFVLHRQDGSKWAALNVREFNREDGSTVYTSSLEVGADGFQKGSGAATTMYLQALNIAQKRGMGWQSEGVRSDAAQAIYSRLKSAGVPFNDDGGASFISADSLAAVDLAAVANKLADANGTTTMFSRTMQRKVLDGLADQLGSAGAKVSWWDKTFATQYAKAEKLPAYKRVFDTVQKYLEDTSSLANEAADKAPGILPKLETWRDLKKFGLSAADAKAIAAPIFEGTLTDEKVYTAEELRTRFGLTDAQVGQYEQFRQAVNTSLDQVVATDVLRLLGDKNPALAELAVTDREGLRTGVLQFLADQIEQADGSEKASLTELRNDIADKYQRVDDLKEKGYAPLMRFGRYAVNVAHKETGESLFFGLYESRAEANRAARDLAGDPELARHGVTQGVLSEQQYKLFQGVPMESLELFANAIGAEDSEVFQAYLKLAKNNRSALKRLIKRKGTAGFSQDVPRVLASFVTSNARLASGGMHLSAATQAASDIRDGDVKDEAIKLLDQVQNPVDRAGAIRGLMFMNFIGGSIASAIVNASQPLTMTLPFLSQYGGMAKAGKQLLSSARAAAGGGGLDRDTATALKRAEREGIVSPQEIHHLQAQAMGSWGKNPALQRVAFLWGAPFSLAEQFNRRVSFIAAYRTAKEQGMADPFGFAETAVTETQGLYNVGNAPNVARGAVGASVMTFKQFSIHYLEWLGRMWKSGPEGKKAVGLALAILLLAAGTDGLPFADDLDDVVDTLGQAMGYDTNSKRWRRQLVAEQLGDEWADVVARGFSASAGVPMDVSLRMGMGNLVPGTGLLLRSNTDRSQDLLEIAGPAGGLAKQALEAGSEALRGDFAGAVKAASPVAIQNLAKGIGMWVNGEARDTKDRRVMATDELDAMVKMIGFNPAPIARESQRMGMIRRTEQLAKNVEGEIAADWARAVADRDTEAVAEARQRLADWNERNPDARIAITGRQIMARVKKLRQDRAQRFITSASPERRRAVAEELAQ